MSWGEYCGRRTKKQAEVNDLCLKFAKKRKYDFSLLICKRLSTVQWSLVLTAGEWNMSGWYCAKFNNFPTFSMISDRGANVYSVLIHFLHIRQEGKGRNSNIVKSP